jgi:hypothetical protein
MVFLAMHTPKEPSPPPPVLSSCVPFEVPSLRTALGEMLGRSGFPQIVLRMGYGPKVAPTPRRSVSEVLL